MKMLHEPKKMKEMMAEPSMGDMLPTVSFSLKQLPEAAKWQVGKTYTLTVKVKQVAMRQRDGQPGSADFQVVGVETSKHEAKEAAKPSTKAAQDRYQEES